MPEVDYRPDAAKKFRHVGATGTYVLAPVDGANFDRLADSLEGQRTRRRDLEPGFAGLLEGVGGDQDLLASCRGAHPSCNVHAPAAVVAAIPRRFGRVQTNPHRR